MSKGGQGRFAGKARLPGIFLVLLLMGALGGCRDLTVQRSLQEGQKALTEKRPEQARHAFDRAVKESGGEPETLLRIALIHYQAGQSKAAGEWLDRAASMDLTPALRGELAMLFQMVGQTETACSEWKRAVDEAPNNGGLVNNYVYSCMVEPGKELDRAIALLNGAIKNTGRQAFVVDSLGWAHFQRYCQTKNTSDLQKAIELLHEAVESEPGNTLTDTDPSAAALRYHLGRAYMEAGDLDAAYVELMKAIALDPGLADAKLALEVVQKHRLAPPPEAEPAPAKKS